MCGILVAPKQEQAKLNQCFLALEKRGPDMSLSLLAGDYFFMFHRLAIMGLHPEGMQPFVLNDDLLVTNGEIYNEKHLRALVDHDFKSQSDCEVLLPLYQKYGTDMFNLLDAEFVTVIYDAKKQDIVAARDPIGIRPLFYGYEKKSKKIAFASEVKGLTDLVESVFPFPPGHYYAQGKFTKYTTLYDTKEQSQTLDDIYQNINNLLTEGIIKRLDSDADLGFLLSGGLDSSLVCAVASKHLKRPIKTFAIGMDTDPIDLKYAKQVAHFIGSDHIEVIMTKDDVLSVLEDVIIALETYDITTVRASIGMYILSRYIHQNTPIKVLLTGEVSDELFGYKYTDFAPNASSFQEESLKRVQELYMYDVLRADRCLAQNSLEARVPFADLNFVNYVFNIDPKLKMNTYGIGKYLLRKAFEVDYLPHDILYREKAAFSDAVGHSMVDHLKAYANSLYSDAVFAKKIKQYTINPPISKESLLYRELFEKHYPNHAHLIKSFWLPNQTWDGCQVDDPSARVLKNYGDSGK